MACYARPRESRMSEADMARKTLAERRTEKLAQLDSIKKELAQLETKAAERIGRIAVRAGIADLDIDDDKLAQEFAAIAAKFQAAGKKPARTDAGAAGTD
jgi:hypothetical protein